MPPISVLMKPSSGMCNMKCDYCFYCDETKKRTQQSFGFMKEETLKNIIRRTMLRAQGGISYAYQGGEPTLRGIDFFKKAVEYQKQYNKHGIQVQNAFQTNGYLLDEEWCRFLKENHFLVGVSLDGIQEIHDAYRHGKDGGPTYERVVRATKLLDEYGVDYNILTVVNRRVAGRIEEIYENYPLRRTGCIPASPSRCRGPHRPHPPPRRLCRTFHAQGRKGIPADRPHEISHIRA